MLCLVLWGKSSIYIETLAFLATRILPLFVQFTHQYTRLHMNTLYLICCPMLAQADAELQRSGCFLLFLLAC